MATVPDDGVEGEVALVAPAHDEEPALVRHHRSVPDPGGQTLCIDGGGFVVGLANGCESRNL